MRDYIELTKPRITWLILMSTGIGYFFGLPAAANWWEFLKHIDLLLLHTVIGTGLIASRHRRAESMVRARRRPQNAPHRDASAACRPARCRRATPWRSASRFPIAGFLELGSASICCPRPDRRCSRWPAISFCTRR